MGCSRITLHSLRQQPSILRIDGCTVVRQQDQERH